jgi:HTH-type transcriptional regulator/antitoxin HigA
MKLLNDKYPHKAELIIPPGASLQEAIDNLGMSQADLALRTGLSKKTINQIIQGHEPISYETAERLERVTGVPASLWNNLEATYRGRLARQKEREQLARAGDWLRGFPIKELIERGVIQEPDDGNLAQATLTFFGVNSPEEWEAVWSSPQAAFRKCAVFKNDPKAVATWLRLGERTGRTLPCAPFDKEKFKAALAQIRALTVERPEVFVPRMKELCAAAGVAFVLMREIKGAPVSGAAYWLSPERALIQMTLRGKADDRFWFTFFHEAGHILKHGKKEKFIDDDDEDSPQEREANRFAEDFLIPPARARELSGLNNRQQIVDFAKSAGIAPGIVVGRLQKLNLLGYQVRENDLKRGLKWVDEPKAGGVEIMTPAGKILK